MEADGEADELVEGTAASNTAHLPKHGGMYTRRKVPAILRWCYFDPQKGKLEYNRSMFMLFYPWRDEHTELTQPPVPLLEKLQDPEVFATIEANAKRYVRMADIDELAKQAQQAQEEADADFDDEEVLRGHTTLQRFQEVDLHDNSAQALQHMHEHVNYDILRDLSAAAQDQQGNAQGSISMIEMTVLPQHEYYALINSLNRQQRSLHDHVLHALKDNADPWQLFVSGGAGVGKSHLLKAVDQSIKRWFLRMPGQDFTKSSVVITAPTGTAAFNVSGLTIHTAASIPPNKDLGEFEFLSHEKANKLRIAWANVKLLIIDEISMVGNRMLHTINLRLQQLRGNSAPFGGMSILAFGDLYQLKPVMDGWVFSPLQDRMAALAPNAWRGFKYFELTQVMRQRNTDFIARLNRLRLGICTNSDADWYRSRTQSFESPDYDATIPHLFLNNKMVNDHNAVFLESLPGEAKRIEAVDSIMSPPESEDARQGLLERARFLESTRTAGLAAALNIKMGAPVELTYNVDVSDGLTNGATGRLCNWSLTADFQVATLYIQFSNPVCGAQARAAHSHATQRLGVQQSWTPVNRTTVQFKLSKASHSSIQRQQFAVRICAARTVHRVQGQSLDRALIDLKGRKQSGMLL